MEVADISLYAQGAADGCGLSSSKGTVLLVGSAMTLLTKVAINMNPWADYMARAFPGAKKEKPGG